MKNIYLCRVLANDQQIRLQNAYRRVLSDFDKNRSHMRGVMPIISILILFLSCSNSTSTKDRETETDSTVVATGFEDTALQYLFDRIDKSQGTSFKDKEILVGKKSIRLKVNIMFDGIKQGKWIYAANITTVYKNDEETHVHFSSIGIGTNRDEAIDICIQEWFGGFGLSFTNMLNNTKGITIAGKKVFSGLMGVRGTLPENTWLRGDDEMIKKIVLQIQSQLNGTTEQLIPIDIKLMIGKNGVTNGECRVGNEVSVELLNALKQLDWPSSYEGFMFKQFYLIQTPRD
jgi:hypothetical protein